MIGLVRSNIFILIFFLSMKNLGCYTQATHDNNSSNSSEMQLMEDSTEPSSTLKINTFSYFITTEMVHNTKSYLTEENSRIQRESGRSTNALEKTTTEIYPDVSITTINGVTKDDQRVSSDSTWIGDVLLSSKIPSASGIPTLQSESAATPMKMTNTEINGLTSNSQSVSPSLKLEFTPVYELTEEHSTTEGITEISIEKTVMASAVNPTVSHMPSVSASFQNIATVTRTGSEINETSFRSEVNPAYTTQTSLFHHSTTDEIDDIICYHDSDCHVNEVCSLQTEGQYICMCVNGFGKNQNGNCVPGIHISLESNLTNPTNMTPVHTSYTDNGASSHMEGPKSLNPASLPSHNVESGRKRFYFNHLSNLTESERKDSVISITFASDIDVIEWFHTYDDIFRQTIEFLIARNISEEYFTDTERVIYIAPTPTKINGSFSVSFMVECSSKINNVCLSAAEVIKKLKDEYSQLEDMLQLQVLSVEMGYALNVHKCNQCTTPTERKTDTIYYLAIGILLVAVMALLSTLIHNLYGRKYNEERIREEKYRQRRRYAPGHHLATDMQCIDGEIREISNHSEFAEEAGKYLNNSSSHSTSGIEAVVVHNDNNSDTEIPKRIHSEISVEEEETRV